MAGSWQQRFLRVPNEIAAKIAQYDEPYVAFGVRRVSRAEVEDGVWHHLAITSDAGGQISVPDPVMPSSDAGPWATRNAEGWVKKRTDLPKIDRTFSHETPNFGDWSKGSHTSYQTRKVYPTEEHPAPGWSLAMMILRQDDEGAEIAFQLEPVFDSETNPDELLFALNVLQESTGIADVRPTDRPVADYARTLQVAWEILPPGNADEVIERVSERLQPTNRERAVLEERVRVIYALKPESFIAGTSGFARYFGAMFREDFVVFENLRYGNAMYVMYENWEQLSRWTRRDLMRSDTDGYERIPHARGWQAHLRQLVMRYRGPRRHR